jgi:KipI family sensor histidine kinase inhibitor
MYDQFKVLLCGDRAVSFEFGDGIALETGLHVQRMFRSLRDLRIHGVVELVPCYRSILVYYDPLVTGVDAITERCRAIERNPGKGIIGQNNQVTIPVVYGGEFGPDLKFVAQYHGISTEEVVRLHTTTSYFAFNGFDPGFPLLIGLPPALETPRLETPRLSVPGGSVAIGGAQTGIYSFDRPGGWRLIGRTPVRMFDLRREPMALVNVGDEVRFIRIDERTYDDILKREECDLESFSPSPSTTGIPESVETFLIRNPGPFTSVQDRGRVGWQRIGVPVSGVLDSYAHRVGNLLLGEPEDTACLEITYMGPTIEILHDTFIVICGADPTPKVNGKTIPTWAVVKVRSGDLLSLYPPLSGCRSYLCVSGGIDVPLFMGSRSTFFRITAGGHHGRVLAPGDRISTCVKRLLKTSEERFLPRKYVPSYPSSLTVRVIPGPQDDYFDETEGAKVFYESGYKVTAESNREGIRLVGPPIKIKEGKPKSIPSEAFPSGGIQVTPGGQPIILLNDSIGGGYAKIAHIISSDLPKIAQLRPGNLVSFIPVTLSRAHEILREEESQIEGLER